MAKFDRMPLFNLRWKSALEDHLIGLHWSPDGKSLAAAVSTGPISIVDALTGEIKLKLPGHDFGTMSIDWHPSGKMLASSGQDGKVRIWDTKSGEQLAEIAAGSAWVEKVVWNAKGRMFAIAAGKKLSVWDKDFQLVQRFPDRAKTISDLHWEPSKGKEIVTGGYGGIEFWDPEIPQPTRTLEWKGAVLKFSISPDGKFIGAGTVESQVHFWFVKTGQDLEMTGYPMKVQEISIDAGSRYLATGGGELVTVWDCSGSGPSGSTPQQFALHTTPVTCLTFQNRASFLASGCESGKIALWMPGGPNQHLAFWSTDSEQEGIAQLSWSPNDAYLAYGTSQGNLGVFAV